MSPLAATKLFYNTYRKLRVDYVREHKDRELAEQLPVMPFEVYIKDPKNLASAWSARQVADTFSVPYGLYLEYALYFWSRRSGGGRSYTPQINQLGYTENTEIAWRDGFKKYVNDRIWLVSRSLSEVPQLHPSVFVGTSEQVAARDFILNLCSRSDCSWRGAVEMWCYSYPVLTPECFSPVVPPDVLTTTIETVALVARDPVGEPDPLPPGALWPTCHGMPDAAEPTSETCAKCQFVDSCSHLASMVKTKVHRQTGHEDPRRVELRKAANERQRRHIAKKKLAAAGVAPSFPSCISPMPEVTLP